MQICDRTQTTLQPDSIIGFITAEFDEILGVMVLGINAENSAEVICKEQ